MKTLNSVEYHNSNIKVIENSEDEILNIYLDQLKQQNNQFTNEDLSLIKEFIDIRDQLQKEFPK